MTPQRLPRNVLATLAFVLACALIVSAQAPTGKLGGQLKQLFPDASSFSAKEGDPPHIKAFAMDARTRTTVLLGLAFFTSDLVPLERGYDGPINMLIGMDTKGVLTGVVVISHKEPFGPISVEKPRFAQQYKGKSIRDPFKVGDDVDAVSTATITITSATRAIKQSARRIAVQYLKPEGK
jgi:NosR/NirI family transcriptional regulator, nitrous oxide reductase regulator